MIEIVRLYLKNNLQLKQVPLAVNRKIINGEVLRNPVCLKCMEKSCVKQNTTGEFVCDDKISSYHVKLHDLEISTFGHLGDLSKLKQGHYAYKSSSKMKYNQFEKIINDQLKPLISSCEAFETSTRTEVLNSFHDASKWARQMSINAENLLRNSKGDSIAEKFRNLPSDLKAIYQCSTLLNDALQAYEIFINPKNVDSGLKRDTQIYQLFDKFQAILFNSEGKANNKSFKLEGESYVKIPTYASFTTVPLSLLHNALKYTIGNAKIIIKFQEISDDKLIIKVISEGSHIDDSEKNKIFEKNFRGKYASELHHDGLGIGLYVASIVARKHNSTITVVSEPLQYERGKIPISRNTFTLTMNIK